MAMQREIALALAHNVQRLMDHFGLSQAELGRRSGIAQRTISTLLDVENPSAINPRARTIEQLASYFGIPAWQLQIPELPLELLLSQRMTKMIENYRDAPESGRAQVERIAESEVRYAVAESALTGEGKKTGSRDR
jgi:transcriptional regulator with XRE-family HTH domain